MKVTEGFIVATWGRSQAGRKEIISAVGEITKTHVFISRRSPFFPPFHKKKRKCKMEDLFLNGISYNVFLVRS
jgi:hypothetical protein